MGEAKLRIGGDLRSFAEWRREFMSAGEERTLKPVEGGDWMRVDGVECSLRGKEYIVEVDYNDKDKKGTYYINNATIAYIGPNSELFIGHQTEENLKALRTAGYQRSEDGFSVPFSNGELPTNPDLARRYQELRRKGEEKAREETIRYHLGEYRKEAERKGIKSVSQKEGFVRVDGVRYKIFGREEEIEPNTDGYNMASGRLEEVGTYYSNNNVLAFVDGEGCIWIGRDNAENLEALRKAGYQRRELSVPFSNGEEPIDQDLSGKLNRLLQRSK